MPTYHFSNDGNPDVQCGTNSGTIEVVFIGPPSGSQSRENTGNMSGLTFGTIGRVPSIIRSDLSGSFSRDLTQSPAEASPANPTSEKNVARPAEGSHTSLQADLSMLETWKAQAEGKLPRPPTSAIEHAQEKRANIMWRVRRAVWKQLNRLLTPGSALAKQPESIKMEVRTAWLEECREWVEYIQDSETALRFVESVLLEERLTGLDPFRSNDEDVKTILKMLPENSQQRAALMKLLRCNRTDVGLEASDDVATNRSAPGRTSVELSGPRFSSIKTWAQDACSSSLFSPQDQSGDPDAAMPDQGVTPPETPIHQSGRIPDEASAKFFTLSQADEQAYTIDTTWLSAYNQGRLPSFVGKMKVLQDDRAGIVAAKISAYESLREALKKIPIDPDLCATLKRRFNDTAELQHECMKLEQTAWAEYIESPAARRGDRVSQYIEYFILEHQLCNLPPSTESDQLVECGRKGLMEGTLANIRVRELLSSRRDKNWRLIETPTQ